VITKRKREEPQIISKAEMDAIEVAAIAGKPITEIYGAELLEQASADPTIDKYLDRSPKLLTDKDYEELVGVLRKKRVAFITAEQKKKEPKLDGEENVEVQEG